MPRSDAWVLISKVTASMEKVRATAMCRQLVADESGQDVVEYALLGALVGIAAIVIWQALVVTVGNVYGAADAGVQVRSSCTPDPISVGGGCS
jgi:Flp pilus assembly pilin Flp